MSNAGKDELELKVKQIYMAMTGLVKLKVELDSPQVKSVLFRCRRRPLAWLGHLGRSHSLDTPSSTAQLT